MLLLLVVTMAVADLSETYVEPRIIRASGLVVTGTFDDRVEIALGVAMPEGAPEPRLEDTDLALYVRADTGEEELIDTEVVGLSVTRQEIAVGVDAASQAMVLAPRRVLAVTFETDPVDGGNAPSGIGGHSSLRLVATPKSVVGGGRTWEATHPDIDVGLTFACGSGLPKLIKIGAVVVLTLGAGLVVFRLARRRSRRSKAAMR